MGSTRLPGKVLLPFKDTVALMLQIHRMQKAKNVGKIVVATSLDSKDDEIESWCVKNNVDIFRGDENDVLDRFYRCALKYNFEYVARSTADCPLIDPQIIDQTIEHFFSSDVDFCNNNFYPTLPDGLDFSVMRFTALEKAWKEATSRSDREHLTMYIINHSTLKNKELFKATCYKYPTDYSKYRFTLDQKADYELIKKLIDACSESASFLDYIDYIEKNPELFNLNKNYLRNEGYQK